jgi:hypothetical protein
VGWSVPGASRSVAVRVAAGSVDWRTGAPFGRVGAREGARFGDGPAGSALRVPDQGGGTLRQPWVSQELGMHSSKLFVPERRNYNLIVFGKNVFKKNQG